jgi:hypothetical protein
VFADVVGHTAPKRAQWQIEHELRKYELALVHGGPWAGIRKKPTSLTLDDVQIETRLKHQIWQANH